MAPSVEPTTLIRNNTRFDESPGGNTETMIDSSVTAKATPLASHTPGFPAGQFDRRGVHVQKRNEVKDDGDVNQALIRAARRFAYLTEQQNRAGNHRLCDDRNVRRLPARMNLAEGLRQVAVDAHDERHARDSRHRAADAACISDGDQNRGENTDE